MKNKLVLVLIVMLAMLNVSNSMIVKAIDDSPAFLIAEDYVIIDYVKYDLVDSKIVYKGL